MYLNITKACRRAHSSSTVESWTRSFKSRNKARTPISPSRTAQLRRPSRHTGVKEKQEASRRKKRYDRLFVETWSYIQKTLKTPPETDLANKLSKATLHKKQPTKLGLHFQPLSRKRLGENETVPLTTASNNNNTLRNKFNQSSQRPAYSKL